MTRFLKENVRVLNVILLRVLKAILRLRSCGEFAVIVNTQTTNTIEFVVRSKVIPI